MCMRDGVIQSPSVVTEGLEEGLGKDAGGRTRKGRTGLVWGPKRFQDTSGGERGSL